MNTGTDTGKQQDNEKEGFTMRVNNRKLKRVCLMVALILAMLINRIYAYAEIEGEPEYKVYNYDDLVYALRNASGTERIGIYAQVTIPTTKGLSANSVTIYRMNRAAQIILSGDTTGTITGIDFNGNNLGCDTSFLEIQGCDASIEYCKFIDCGSNYSGGAVTVMSNNNTNFAFCTFDGNGAGYGGAVALYGWSKNTFYNCEFTGNSADQGGAVYQSSYSTATFTNCVITGCNANIGGGIYTDSDKPLQ